MLLRHALNTLVLVISGRTTPQSWQPAMPVLPALVFFSVIWTFWDPSYSSLQKAYIQGRDIRLQGRSQYIVGECNALQICSAVLTTVIVTAPASGGLVIQAT